MLLNNDEKVKDVITQYYNIIQGNLKSSQVFIRATEFNSDVRKVQKAKLLIPDEQILLNDPIPQRRQHREIYEKIYTRIPKVAEAEKEKANRLLEQIGTYLDYKDIDDEDIEFMQHEFISYRQAMDYYNLGYKPIVRLSHKAGAVYKIGKKVLIKRSTFEKYLRENIRREKEEWKKLYQYRLKDFSS